MGFHDLALHSIDSFEFGGQPTDEGVQLGE